MSEAITKDNVFIARCIMFERIPGNYLIPKTLPVNETYRKILYFRGKVIDFKLADDLEILPYDKETETVTGHIKTDTYYIEEVFECKSLTNKDMEYIPDLLTKYQEKKIKENARKLIKFPGKTLN